MSLFAIFVQTVGLSKNLVGEMVVLVDEEEHLGIGLLAFTTQKVQLLDRTIQLVHTFFDAFRQILRIYIAEKIKGYATMVV